MNLKSRGYIFLETILLLFMTVIITLFAFSGMNLAEKTKLRCKVNEVVQRIEYIKNTSAVTGLQYNVYCFNDRILFRKGIDCLDKVILYDNMEVPSGITGKWIRFKGSAAPNKAGTIEIVDKKLKTRARITVGVATGKIRVYYEKI